MAALIFFNNKELFGQDNHKYGASVGIVLYLCLDPIPDISIVTIVYNYTILGTWRYKVTVTLYPLYVMSSQHDVIGFKNKII